MARAAKNIRLSLLGVCVFSNILGAAEIADYGRLFYGGHSNSGEASIYDLQSGQRIENLKVVPLDRFSEGLCRARDAATKLEGFIDRRGRFVIEPGLLEGYAFSEGRALVRTAAGLGMIDRLGGWVVKPGAYEGLGSCHSGRVAFLKNKRLGFLDRWGDVVIDAFYGDVGQINDIEGFGFQDERCLVVREGEWFYIDVEGKRLVLPEGIVPDIQGFRARFSEGLAPVRETFEERWGEQRPAQSVRVGFVDTAGKVVIPPWFASVGGFREGLAAASLNDPGGATQEPDELQPTWRKASDQERKRWLWGFIDPTGKVIIPMEYERVGHFCCGLANVRDGQEWGYIDRTGAVVIPCQFKLAWTFEKGVAQVVLPNGEMAWIGLDGKVVINTHIVYHPGI